jgi:hypothetical protein
MKKTVFQMAVAVMLLLMGCSKDELPNDTNNELKLKKGSNTSTEIIFESNSIANNNFIELAPGYLYPVRKILSQGIFTGSINGIGVINSRQSTYEITNYEILPNDHLYDLFDTESRLQYLTYPDEKNMYKITIDGNIIINVQDHCSFHIEGNIYPICYYPLTSSEVGSFEGTGVIHSGTRKLANLNDKKFRAFGRPGHYGVTFFNGNHNTGDFNLIITDNLVTNN